MQRYPLLVGLASAWAVGLVGGAVDTVLAQDVATPPAGSAGSGYGAVVADTPGLVAYWRLDETSGTEAADSAGQGRAATIAPGVALGAPGLLGETDSGILLNGSDDAYVDVGDVFDFAAGEPFTLEVWIRLDGFANPYPRLIMKEATDDGGNRQGYLLYISKETGRLGFERWRDGEANVVTTVDPIAIGAVTYVAAVYDGQAMRLYVDGEGVAEVPAGLGLIDTAAPFRVGARADGANAFAGEIDEVAVYDRALDSETIRAHFVAGSAGRPVMATPAAATPTLATVAPVLAPPPAATTTREQPPIGIATAAPIATSAPAATVATATPTETVAPTPTEEPPAAEQSTGVTTDALNLRSAPDTESDILLVIPAGETVTLTGDASDGFVAVDYQEESGWVSVDFLDLGAAEDGG